MDGLLIAGYSNGMDGLLIAGYSKEMDGLLIAGYSNGRTVPQKLNLQVQNFCSWEMQASSSSLYSFKVAKWNSTLKEQKDKELALEKRFAVCKNKEAALLSYHCLLAL